MTEDSEKAKISCDGPGPGASCEHQAEFECTCRRCEREDPYHRDPESRFHCCQAHRADTSAYHERVYGRPALWSRIRVPEREWEEAVIEAAKVWAANPPDDIERQDAVDLRAAVRALEGK